VENYPQIFGFQVYHPSRREKFHERAFIAPVKLTDEMGG
jgi:hypothetical protein